MGVGTHPPPHLLVILESSASFAKSPIKSSAVHKVQPALALLAQLCKIRSNILRIRVLRNLPDCKIPRKHLKQNSGEIRVLDTPTNFLDE